MYLNTVLPKPHAASYQQGIIRNVCGGSLYVPILYFMHPTCNSSQTADECQFNSNLASWQFLPCPRLNFSMAKITRCPFINRWFISCICCLSVSCFLAKGGNGHRWDWARPTAGEARARECRGGRRRWRWGDGGQSRRLESVLRRSLDILYSHIQ